MRKINIDRDWMFGWKTGDVFSFTETPPVRVDLPHDYMIGTEVSRDAIAQTAMGFYTGKVGYYQKALDIPAEWEGEQVTLCVDGAMMNAVVLVNGCRVTARHYGYAPFEVDISRCLYYGEKNTVRVILNPSMQPNSRWYSGAGLFRGVWLAHKPKLHLANDGIYAYTKEIEYDGEGKPETAFLAVAVDVVNQDLRNLLARVEVCLTKEGDEEAVLSRSTVIQVNPQAGETAHLTMTVDKPLLWDADHPHLYRMSAKVTEEAEFRTHRIETREGSVDEDSVLFGIRTIRADVRHGLRINGKTVKLRGGCLHHDNGVAGIISLYDMEARKVSKLKEAGFNAVRTTHNPPSAALIEACDRLGLYVFDEAFDAWGMSKQAGDYGVFFDADWERDLEAFVRRDRSHPAVILWSTGNEITERGGLNNGYTLAGRLAAKVKSLDVSRPVSNGVCSFWSGLDEKKMEEIYRKLQEKSEEEVGSIQNADVEGSRDLTWEIYTEPFTNGMDVVGYNYLEDRYEQDHELFPERVILGSENFPVEIGFRWPMVERLSYVIGDFTWTAWDYIGEAGIGRAFYLDPDDPKLSMERYQAVASVPVTYPWRLANDADFDINGNMLPQGAYRSVVWGSERTFVYSYRPEVFGKKELLSNWGFPAVEACWNWKGDEGKPVTLVVFSAAGEVELFVNGASQGRVRMTEAERKDFPRAAYFDVVYEPGTVTAVSYAGGKEISRAELATTGEPAAIRLVPEKDGIPADGHGSIPVGVEIVDRDGRVVPDAEILLEAQIEGGSGTLYLAGFGSANPVTEENYQSGRFHSFRGRAMAILRSGYEKGTAKLTVRAEDLPAASVLLTAE